MVSEIIKEIYTIVPKEKISDAVFEGANIVLYTKDKKFFQDDEGIVRKAVNHVKKRIELRPDQSLCSSPAVAEKKLRELIPVEAGMGECIFDLQRSVVIVEAEKPHGVIVQFGGQTPLKLALRLQRAGVNILGTSPDNIDLAEDRKRFGNMLSKMKIPQPENGTAMTTEEARIIAQKIGYPILVRPSYVLGGRGMNIVYTEGSLVNYMNNASLISPDKPILVDKFLEDAIEVDCDAIFDGSDLFIGGIMEHIEEAGIHSGDSACVLPPFTLSKKVIDSIKDYT